MIDREALAAALETYDERFEAQTYSQWHEAIRVLVKAARERLAQLPPYPSALVERIADALEPHLPESVQPYSLRLAESVLDALNTETSLKADSSQIREVSQ